jgi:hypothetical protein
MAWTVLDHWNPQYRVICGSDTLGRSPTVVGTASFAPHQNTIHILLRSFRHSQHDYDVM